MAKERSDLLEDALKINGQYIEDLVTGYRTIKAKGRESLAKEIETYDTGEDGARLKKTRFPERKIEVEYHVHRTNLADLRTSMHKLQTVLNVENAKIVFNDDSGCYYRGTPVMDDSVDDMKNAVSGTFEIICLDPFKYSSTDTTVNISTYSETVKDEDGNTTTVTSNVLTTNNDGGYKTYPSFDVQFATDEDAQGEMGSDADCGYVLFSKGGTKYSIQIGNDAEKDTTTVTEVAQDFKKTRGSFSDLNTPTPPTGFAFQGSSKVETTATKGPGLKANSLGTAVSGKLYGPLVVYDVGHDLTGAFKLTWKQVLACAKDTATGKKQMGAFWVFLLNSSNVIKYGIGIQKKGTSSLKGSIWTYEPGIGLYIGLNNVDLSYTNELGYKSTTDTAGRLGTSYISRYIDDDGDWKMELYTLSNGFSLTAPENSPTPIRKVAFFFGGYNSAHFYSNRVTEAKLVNGDFDNVNSFGSGDFVTVDVGAAKIVLNDVMKSSLGDYANDWSDMYLDVGTNVIYTQHSPWVTAGYEPTITMRYRKRWL